MRRVGEGDALNEDAPDVLRTAVQVVTVTLVGQRRVEGTAAASPMPRADALPGQTLPGNQLNQVRFRLCCSGGGAGQLDAGDLGNLPRLISGDRQRLGQAEDKHRRNLGGVGRQVVQYLGKLLLRSWIGDQLAEWLRLKSVVDGALLDADLR